MEGYSEIDILVFNEIFNASKSNPISGKKLCNKLKLSFTKVKRSVSKLREEFPIVSKEKNGGGYWIACDELDILEFIAIIEKHKQSYEETINKMSKFIK